MRLLILAWGLLMLVPREADAQRVAPAGERWWCTTMTLFNTSESSWCARTRTGCERHREAWLQDQSEYSNPDASECEPQAKATVLFFFSVMHDEDRYWIHGTMAHCRAMRSQLAALKGDVTRLSACTIVGARRPPKPNAMIIPKGKKWFCFELERRFGDGEETTRVGGCYRDQEECEEIQAQSKGDLVDEAAGVVYRTCDARQIQAYAFTLGKSAAAFPTVELCNQFRAMTTDLGPSLCASFR